jgi:hypothetical protein
MELLGPLLESHFQNLISEVNNQCVSSFSEFFEQSNEFMEFLSQQHELHELVVNHAVELDDKNKTLKVRG